MSNYVDFEYYSQAFLGSLSQPEFEKHLITARSRVDRAADYSLDPEKLTESQLMRLRNCICELVDATEASYQRSGISSESIGDMSVTYADTGSYYAKTADDIIERWLGDLFAGRYGWV